MKKHNEALYGLIAEMVERRDRAAEAKFEAAAKELAKFYADIPLQVARATYKEDMETLVKSIYEDVYEGFSSEVRGLVDEFTAIRNRAFSVIAAVSALIFAGQLFLFFG